MKPYSYIGYMCAYLRYYYPLEFITVLLNINKDNLDKTSEIIEFAQVKGISLSPIKFGESRENYNCNKNNNTITKGLSSLKYLNAQVAEELYELSKKKYQHFLDLLIDINQTSTDTRQLTSLIMLNFFDKFGPNKKLLDYTEMFFKFNGKKSVKKSSLEQYGNNFKKLISIYSRETDKTFKDLDSYNFLKEVWYLIPDDRLPIQVQLEKEKEVLGHYQTKIDGIKPSIGYVSEIDTKYSPKLLVYMLNSGVEKQFKVQKQLMKKCGIIEKGMIIKIQGWENKRKSRFNPNTQDYEKLDEMEQWITQYSLMESTKLDEYLQERGSI